MMQCMRANSLQLKEKVDKAGTMVVKVIRVLEGEIRLAEVNHLAILGSKWWCKRSSKVVARWATAMMMVIRLWCEPDTRRMTMHLHQDWDLGHWSG